MGYRTYKLESLAQLSPAYKATRMKVTIVLIQNFFNLLQRNLKSCDFVSYKQDKNRAI